jgi:hypothetical protein
MRPPVARRCADRWEFPHAVRNDPRQLHHLLAQSVIFLNIASNAIAVRALPDGITVVPLALPLTSYVLHGAFHGPSASRDPHAAGTQ